MAHPYDSDSLIDEHDEDVHAPPQCMYTQDVVSWTDARACRLATALPFQRTAQDQPAHAAGDGFGGPVVATYHTMSPLTGGPVPEV